MSNVDADGFHADDLATIYADLQAAMQSIFGPDLNLAPDTLDGQTIGIYAESKSDSDSLAQDVYNSFNPQTATGVALSRIVEYNGIRRIPAQPSQGVISCVGRMGTHIPINSLVQCTANNEQFVTIQDAYIDETGTVDIMVLSVNYGAIQAPAYTLTKIVTPVFGWQSVTNIADVILGTDEESDEDLRIRRAASTATPAQSVPDSIYGAISNIPGVVQARLYENYSGVVDANGLPPHSFCAVVYGGADTDIANAIWNRASIGAEQIGNTTVTVYDVQGFPHVITFKRPTPIRVYISIAITKLPGWGDAIISDLQDSFVAWSLKNWLIGSSIVYSRLYEPINAEPPVFSVTSLKVDTVTPPVNAADIHLPFDSIATLDPNDIVITVT